MEKEEKVRYGMLLFLSTLVFNESSNLVNFSYDTGLAKTLKDIMPWITVLLAILLGLALLLIALDFLVAGIIPDAIITLLTWIYILILSILIIVIPILNQLKF